jgi:DNA-binding MarR family transcriptional regulator
MVSKRQDVVKIAADEFARLVADVFQAAGLFRQAGESIAGAEGQTQARWQAMSVVSDRPMTVPQAARRLGITRQAVQRVVNDLVTARLLRLIPNPDHRNSPLLELTEDGRQSLERITTRAYAFNSSFAPAVTAAQLAQARATLRTIIDQMTAD